MQYSFLIKIYTRFLRLECRQMSAQNVLLKELLGGYGFQSTRPVYNVSDVTTVVFSLVIRQVIELVMIVMDIFHVRYNCSFRYIVVELIIKYSVLLCCVWRTKACYGVWPILQILVDLF